VAFVGYRLAHRARSNAFGSSPLFVIRLPIWIVAENALLKSGHGLWKSVTQSLDHLEQREIDVGRLLAENEVAAFGAGFENPFEIAEKFRDSD
jgi:hypothetical protein